MILAAVFCACLQEPTLTADVGFSGTAFPDSWTRVTALVRNDVGTLEGELRVVVRGPDLQTSTYRRALLLHAPARQRFDWDVYLTGTEDEIDVELVDARGSLIRRSILRPRFAGDKEIRILGVGPYSGPLSWERSRIELAMARVSKESLPDACPPLLATDVVVFTEPEDLRWEQEEALRRWVALGGRLVFASGTVSAVRQQRFWAEMCPMEVSGTSVVTIKARREIQVPMTVGTIRRGTSLLSLGGNPAAVRRRVGRGEVVFLSFPLDTPGIETVLSAENLWKAILLKPDSTEVVPDPRQRRGKTYFVGAQRFLGDLPDAEMYLSPLSLVLGALVLLAYVVLMGPVDYFRLRRKGRLRRGWISFAALTAGAIAFSLIWGRFFSPRETESVHLILADEGLVQSFTSVRAARDREYSVAAQGSLSPVSGMMGFKSEGAGELSLTGDPPSLRILAPALSTRTMVSCRIPKPGEIGVSCRWTDRAGNRMETRNSGRLNLGDCRIVSKERVYEIGNLPPGGNRSFALSDLSSKPLDDWLKSLSSPESRRFSLTNSGGFSMLRGARQAEALSFFEAYRKALRKEESWVRSVDRHRPTARGLDLSPALDDGAWILVGLFREDLSGLEFRPGQRTEVRGLLRILVSEDGE